ncbi:MAG: DUF192 domain-containing protein, partial [Bdellovibrionota bacterium]
MALRKVLRKSGGLLFAFALVFLAACPPEEKAGPGEKEESPTEGKLPRGALTFEGGPEIQIEIATAPEELRIGLSYREKLCGLCGLYFVFPEEQTQTFWMRRMRFPIDILWLRAGKVAGTSENLPPPKDPNAPEWSLPRYESPVPVRHVLEVPAGFVQKHGLRV